MTNDAKGTVVSDAEFLALVKSKQGGRKVTFVEHHGARECLDAFKAAKAADVVPTVGGTYVFLDTRTVKMIEQLLAGKSIDALHPDNRLADIIVTTLDERIDGGFRATDRYISALGEVTRTRSTVVRGGQVSRLYSSSVFAEQMGITL